MLQRFFLSIVLLLSPQWASAQWQLGANTAADRYSSSQTAARLIAHAPEGVGVGKPLWLGVEITHQPNWHTYWRNSGDSGIPTEIQWQLPPGWQAGALQWPTPKKFKLGPLGNYGYDDTVLLAAPIQVTETVKGDLNVTAQANWLACRTECIPEYASLSLRLPVNVPITSDSHAFSRHASRLPVDQSLAASMRLDGDHLLLSVDHVPPPWQGQALEIYPEVAGLIIPGADWVRQWQGNQLSARLPLNPEREASPEAVHWVLAASPPEHGLPAAAGLRIRAQMQGPWPSVTSPTVPVALQAALAQRTQVSTPTVINGYGWSLLLAFVGGMLLNLMPCVFPVLAIKVLAFAQNDNARIHRLSGLAYTAGVVLSFTALAAVLLTLRSAGEAVGWGFQLQHPATVAALAVLFTFIAFNLFGWFEVQHLLPGRWAGLRLRHPVADAAWSGVLSTAVASPCTAPFMGAALGAAIAMPTPQALLLFATLGLGMALPYLALSWFPFLSRALPGPGAWMQTFKELMAFPMLATVVWLLWVLGQQSGIHGATALLLGLVALGFGLWLMQRARGRLWRTFAIAVMASAAWFLWPMATTLAPVSTHASALSSGWQAWSPSLERQARAQGLPVFVDFTAAWCVTCQVNELGAMRDPRVLQAFQAGGWQLLRADWTRHDAEITQALNALQRNGVPTYAVYHPGQGPIVLSELLTAEQLLDALHTR